MARKPTDIVALQVRLPDGLRRKLAQAADKNARSLNSEIVWRLGQSLGAEGAGFSEQLDAFDKQIERVLDEFVHSPEAQQKLIDQLAANPDFQKLVAKRGAR